MCSFSMKTQKEGQIDGRRVLQPAGNRVNPGRETGRPMKKLHEIKMSPPSGQEIDVVNAARPVLFTPKTAHKKTDDPNGLNFQPTAKKTAPALFKNSKNSVQASACVETRLPSPVQEDKAAMLGSIAAAQRAKATVIREEKKKKISHYGRSSGKISVSIDSSSSGNEAAIAQDEKRCSFITPNSDPIYVVYHDEEWGVPVHDDKMLFELMVLAGAQVGLDWTTILRKREDFRSAFAGFDPEVVSKFTEKQMAAISSELGMDLTRVRGIADNAKCILEVRKQFGSLDNYFWRFVNNRPILTQYSSCRRIPVKTSKSEAISKDMVRRGFRIAGSTVIHSFMQAAGLTNDHLLSCPRHHQLMQLHSATSPTTANTT